jgi:hypothetical protein
VRRCNQYSTPSATAGQRSETHNLAVDPAAIEGIKDATAGSFDHDGLAVAVAGLAMCDESDTSGVCAAKPYRATPVRLRVNGAAVPSAESVN